MLNVHVCCEAVFCCLSISNSGNFILFFSLRESLIFKKRNTLVRFLSLFWITDDNSLHPLKEGLLQPNCYWSRTTLNLSLQSNWITVTCHYTQLNLWSYFCQVFVKHYISNWWLPVLYFFVFTKLLLLHLVFTFCQRYSFLVSFIFHGYFTKSHSILRIYFILFVSS